jgi:hypothetical protein
MDSFQFSGENVPFFPPRKKPNKWRVTLQVWDATFTIETQLKCR